MLATVDLPERVWWRLASEADKRGVRIRDLDVETVTSVFDLKVIHRREPRLVHTGEHWRVNSSRGHGQRFDPDERKEIDETIRLMVAQGVTVHRIALDLGVSSTFVDRAKKRLGLTKPRKASK